MRTVDTEGHVTIPVTSGLELLELMGMEGYATVLFVARDERSCVESFTFVS